MPDYVITCLPPKTKSGGDEVLRLSIGGSEVGITLRIGQLNKQLVEGLKERALDLLEIAAVAYCADAAISRGGSADQEMGKKWHRRFVVEMPVRALEFWKDTDVVEALEETLMFLSGDRFAFTFVDKTDADAERSRFFRFGSDSAWQADRVLMFSGGLDSFAGALEEIVEHRHRVALVSHFSASKIAPVQRRLQKALLEKFGSDTCRHIPVQAQLTAGSTKESTHRSRSFLFAVLGAITAQAFGLRRVSFHKNGVVSLNLPPVGNVLGTRATRTTHPQTLALLTRLLGMVFDDGLRVDNPFFLRTKADVVDRIAQLGMDDQIVETRSCADIHNQTKQFFHCGRCSQCIDRRFAILAKGLERFDPEDAYRVDLLSGARQNVVDREIALSYVRNAQFFEHGTPESIERSFPAVLDAVNYLGQPANTALSMIAQLLNRHGASVTSVMRSALDRKSPADYPVESLPRLYGDMQSAVASPEIVPTFESNEMTVTKPLAIEVDVDRRLILIEDRIELRETAATDLLIELTQAWLDGAGQGLELLDYPFKSAAALAEGLGLDGDGAVRQSVNRTRTTLAKKFESAGLDASDARSLIENIPWQGYRLRPDRIVVRVIDTE